MFTPEQRDRLRDRIVALARSDPRVVAGAITGSSALGAQDAWSDVDIAFGISDETLPEAILDEWTTSLADEYDASALFDLRAGNWIYRVFLLPSGLEVDVAVAPQQDFGARGPRFTPLFGSTHPQPSAPPPDARHLIGLACHHVLHARSCIERGKVWQGEYWISALRDHVLALACFRLGEDTDYARGVDRLPAAITAPLADTLVRSLDATELRRALAAATTCLLVELEIWDPAFCARLRQPLREFGTPSTTSEDA
jgi:hypothetical protein